MCHNESLTGPPAAAGGPPPFLQDAFGEKKEKKRFFENIENFPWGRGAFFFLWKQRIKVVGSRCSRAGKEDLREKKRRDDDRKPLLRGPSYSSSCATSREQPARSAGSSQLILALAARAGTKDAKSEGRRACIRTDKHGDDPPGVNRTLLKVSPASANAAPMTLQCLVRLPTYPPTRTYHDSLPA